MNLGIFLISFTYSAIYSELLMDQKILGTWDIILKKINSLTSYSHYVISRKINGKHRNVTCHKVMGAFHKIKASKRCLEGEKVGNTILFGTIRKETLWPWSREIIWSEIFLKDHTGYCIRNRWSGNQSEGFYKKYRCLLLSCSLVVAVKMLRNDKFWIYQKRRVEIIC